jgi:tetratricopeptide (TPR) repeat protein
MLAVLVACGQIEQLLYSDDPLSYVEELASEQRFEQALQFMENLPPVQRDNSLLKKRYKKLQLESMAYEKTQVDQAQKLASKKDWVAALNLLDQSLDNYERGALLQQSHQKISAQQQDDLQRLWLRFNEQRGKSIPGLSAQIEGIIAAGDDSDEAADIQVFYREQSTLLSDYFAQQADLQVSMRQWRRAIRYFELADKLSPQARYQNEVARIQKRLMSQQVANKTAEEMLRQFDDQLAKGELLAAQTSLDVMAELHKATDIRQQREALQQRIDVRLQNLISRGRDHYAKGELDAAISLWRQGLILQPEEKELIDLLTRAEAFKAHYEKLREAK